MIRMAWILSLLGLLPFLMATGLVIFVDDMQALGMQILIAYGASILAFLGGIHWGVGLKVGGPADLLASIVPSLVAFAALVTHGDMALIILLAGFVSVLSTDWRYANQEVIPSWFWQLRRLITVVVVACFIVSYLKIW